MVWALALDGKDDQDRFKEIRWALHLGALGLE